MKKSLEYEVQSAAIELLTILGFRTLVTSRIRKRCYHCGRFSAGGDGVSKGLPDLIVTKDSWPPYLFIGVEIKGPETKLSPDQKELAEKDRILIVRDIQDLHTQIKRIDVQIKTTLSGAVAS